MFAVIFDMDGVISDTQKVHAKVESELLAKHGVHISPEEVTRKYAGVKTSEFFKELLGGNVDKIMQEKWALMAELAKQGIEPMEGSVELIKMLGERGVKMAVASASDYAYVIEVLTCLGIENYFEIIVTGDQVSKGKPDPESFLLAAERMEVSPFYCIVIEDGRRGMVAAKKVGMKCIGLVEDESKNYPADILVKSMLEVDLKLIGIIDQK